MSNKYPEWPSSICYADGTKVSYNGEECVVGNPIETYTFSRALHLMRYGGKYTQSDIDDQEKFCVVLNDLLRSLKINGIWTVPQPVTGLPSAYIMGSWVEVK